MCKTPDPVKPNIADPLPSPTKTADDLLDPLKIRKREKANKKALTKKRDSQSPLNVATDGVGLAIGGR